MYTLDSPDEFSLFTCNNASGDDVPIPSLSHIRTDLSEVLVRAPTILSASLVPGLHVLYPILPAFVSFPDTPVPHSNLQNKYKYVNPRSKFRDSQ